MKMKKKTSWKLRLGAACLCILLTAGVAWAAGLFDRDDQDIRGFWTFRQDVSFKGDVDIDGTLSAQQYSSVFYVHSGTGGDVPQFGKSRNSPFDSVEYAIQRCTANKGDIIVVMPGHNEGGTAAGGTATTGMWDADVAGIKIVGFGRGTDRPTFDFDGTAATCAIGAANVTIQGLRFRPSTASVVIGLSIEGTGDYARIVDCEFGFAETTGDELLISINVAEGANYVTVENSLLDAEAQNANSAIKIPGGTEGLTIRNNVIKGDYAVACINGTATASESMLIDNNHLWNGDPSGALNAQPGIELLTASTGLITRNMIFCDIASTLTASVVCDACTFHENYVTDDIAGPHLTTKLLGTASSDG